MLIPTPDGDIFTDSMAKAIGIIEFPIEETNEAIQKRKKFLLILPNSFNLIAFICTSFDY
ncbi:hypothetical protein VCRA2121O157_180031 [Vibrio crassostreae]|nr:hypothetical protein VCRA2113O138_180030 [Vibrio crassostreae]CAK1814944.1 hypothetical protein VCRA2113O140_180071 [Vibrio crassostreae]CAK2678339.1 hypothetical protein VCRA2119O148_180031 [Vibrio crassostreae]CAK2683219.1 hypothetical protein VCRA2113O139_180030 [Vibrio crassostreae]CAK2684519.1 hypothetical protein VCRA2121O154_180071 [Vibrio crassostreae]